MLQNIFCPPMETNLLIQISCIVVFDLYYQYQNTQNISTLDIRYVSNLSAWGTIAAIQYPPISVPICQFDHSTSTVLLLIIPTQIPRTGSDVLSNIHCMQVILAYVGPPSPFVDFTLSSKVVQHLSSVSCTNLNFQQACDEQDSQPRIKRIHIGFVRRSWKIWCLHPPLSSIGHNGTRRRVKQWLV